MRTAANVLKWIVVTILTVFFVIFSYQNMEGVTIYFLGYNPFHFPVFLIILLPTALTAYVALTFFKLASIKRQRKIDLLEKHVELKTQENKQLHKELKKLSEETQGRAAPRPLPRFQEVFEGKNPLELVVIIVDFILIVLMLLAYSHTKNPWIYIWGFVPLVILTTTFFVMSGLKKRFIDCYPDGDEKNIMAKKLDILTVPVNILLSIVLITFIYTSTALMIIIQVNF